MSRRDARRLLDEVARARAYPADDETLDRLLDYLESVLAWRGRVNLTAALDLHAAVRILALSALAVVRAWEAPAPPSRIVDLGTGNGLPGVAAALAWPESEVLLVERRGRKAEAVRVCVEAIDLRGVEVIHADARELMGLRPELRGGVDLVTVRAVGSLEDALRMTKGWYRPGGRLAHWKGARLEEDEIRRGERAARATGLRPLPALAFEDDAGPARLVLYEHTARA